MRDSARLEETLGKRELRWLVERCRERLERGGGVSGTVSLRAPSDEQREALDRFLGRRGTTGATLVVDLERVERVLREAEIADELREAVEYLTGELVDRPALARREARAWARVEALVLDHAEARPELRSWWAAVQRDGYLRRASNGDADRAVELVELVLAVLEQLPADGIPLPELAASVAGNSHALDGGPLGTLVLRALAAGAGSDDCSAPEDRRELWAAAGVMCDELSSPALVLNLRSADRGLTGRMLEAYGEAGEPARLSVRQLLRHPPDFAPFQGRAVFVCENAAIMAAAAARLGSRAAPLVCTEGQFRTAVRVLLGLLSRLGAQLYARADFDWAGVHIVRRVTDQFGARPWRMGTTDYRVASAGPALKGQPADTPWDSELRHAMIARGTAVHEEQIADRLLTDLAY